MAPSFDNINRSGAAEESGGFPLLSEGTGVQTDGRRCNYVKFQSNVQSGPDAAQLPRVNRMKMRS